MKSENMGNNILVTGATGFVGKIFLKKLIEKGYKVRCIVRDKKNPIKSEKVETVFGDITKKQTLKSSMEDIDAVFHLAVLVSVNECINNPMNAYETNTLGTLNLLEEARKETQKSGRNLPFIYLSTDRVYGGRNCRIKEDAYAMPLEPYSVSKLDSELLIKCYNVCYGIQYVILRSANIYGYGQSRNFLIPNAVCQVLEGKHSIRVGNTNVYRNFIHVDDLTDALILVLEKMEKCKNSVLNISESNVMINYLLQLIGKMTAIYLNREVQFTKDKKLTRRLSTEPSRFELDCTKIYGLGWRPKIDFEQGIRKTFKEFMEQKRNGTIAY